MKKIFLTTVAISALATPALAETNADFFIGANYSFAAQVSYVSEAEESMDEVLCHIPDFYQAFGGEAGFKLSFSDVPNFGIGASVAYDYAFDEDAVVKYPYSDVFSEVKMGFSALSVMANIYANIDFSTKNKGGLIFGIGYANLNERVEISATDLAKEEGFYGEKADTDGGALALKIGMFSEIKDGFGLNMTLRYFAATGDTDISDALLVGVGLQYTF